MKIGIFAGTFDPVHEGHIAFAKNAIDEAELERVVMVAEKEPYRKKPHASWDHRQAMIERATKDTVQVDHDYRFANQLARQHTMKDMLAVAEKHYGIKHEYWFLVGSDTFEHMHKWQDVVADEHYGGFTVALRGNHTQDWLQQKVEQLQQFGPNVRFVVVTNTVTTISSSTVRDAIKAGQPATGASSAVSQYITERQLYR